MRIRQPCDNPHPHAEHVYRSPIGYYDISCPGVQIELRAMPVLGQVAGLVGQQNVLFIDNVAHQAREPFVIHYDRPTGIVSVVAESGVQYGSIQAAIEAGFLTPA